MTAVIEISDLRVEARLARSTQVILQDIALEVHAGEILGVVGESGSGKTTLVRSLVGLLDKNVRVVDGAVRFDGERILAPGVDDTARIRGGKVGMVFQDAQRSLNPVFKVRTQLREVLKAHRGDLSAEQMHERMVETLRRMKVADPERVLDSYPHQLSGGLAQRVAIALAVVTGPEVVLADECTTALDVTTQAEVVVLFRELVRESRIALVFVTHNLMLAAELCDRVVVMYAGQAVESGPTERVLHVPHHPYSAGLLASVPGWDDARTFSGIAGAAPRVVPEFVGCRFADRCPHVTGACRAGDVAWTIAPDGGGYRCVNPLALPGG